ncbi:MAG: hypothetical protein LBG80_17180 [Bacteroidales bacterium]|jgi:hypothetical protein|nr:hypothetical protein [Bacteroidales bacterium]
MGELSKRIGEYGENIVEQFLVAIGWKNLQKGFDIPCLLNDKHSTTDAPRRTHGIDFLYTYKSPLISNVLNNVVISSKFKTKKYPNNPNVKFKEYFDDLAIAIECFSISEKRNEITKGFDNYSKINDIGLLFWLNNSNEEGNYSDLIGKISNAQIKDDYNIHCIFVVDNKRVMFILDAIRFLKSEFQNFDFFFYYPNTGQNISPIERENTGTYLPVEYINSSILPIKLQNKDNAKEVYFALFSIDGFEKDDFRRIMGVAKDISTNLTSKVFICFPDYNEISHSNEAKQAKQQFTDTNFSSTVFVKNYRNQFPNTI